MTLANHSLLEFYAWNSNGPIRCNRYVAAAKRGKTRVSRSHDPDWWRQRRDVFQLITSVAMQNQSSYKIALFT